MVDKSDKKPESAEVHRAKMAFMAALMDLSWRLAGTFLLPVVIGFAIDKYRDTEYAVVIGTITGFTLSVIFIINMGLKASKK